jgi:hypothetical protein
MTMDGISVPWVSLLALGAIHGINPAMGWLFAVARGLQERDRRALWLALGPIALGHALAIGLAVALAASLGRVVPMHALRWLVAASLLLVGLEGLLRHRHVRLGGMRVTKSELATWSFLMASAHGAGLMVIPFVLGAIPPATGMGHAHTAVSPGANGEGIVSVLAPVIHTLGYLMTTILVAVVVYEKVGLRILRRGSGRGR